MALEDLIGSVYGLNMQLPLQYGNLMQSAYSPLYGYMGQQAGNQASLGSNYVGQMGSIGQSGMGLYGNLAGLQAGMYQSELPFQMEQQKYNSLAPVLGGLLSQGGLGSFNISPVSMNFNRPDVMSGYTGAVDRAYRGVEDAYGKASNNTQAYDQKFYGSFSNMLDEMPQSPFKMAQQQKPPRGPMITGSHGTAPYLGNQFRPTAGVAPGGR